MSAPEPQSSAEREAEAGAEPEATRADEAIGARAFHVVLLALCATYFALEVYYIGRLPLVMDEFQGASSVYKLRHAVPYRDFQPYKTVLGYYTQLPAMLLGGDVWSQMMRIKQWMALLTAIGVFGVGAMLARSFRRHAVLLGVVSLLCVSTFLERSAALRVDMLTAVVGFVSLGLLSLRRPGLAGVAAGLSFLVSQKGAYYCFAGGVALGTYWLVQERTRARLADAARFTVAALATMALYVGVFALIGSFGEHGDTVSKITQATVVAPKQIALDVMYKRLGEYWVQTVTRNPYFYAVAVMGIGVAFEATRQRRSFRDWLTWTYAGTVLSACVWHKQPWPYFFVVLLPTLAVPCMVVFERVAKPRAWLFWVLFLALGVAFPLKRISVVAERDQAYQRYTVRLAETALGRRDTYLAGVNIIYTRRQSPRELAWLDKKGIGWVRSGHTAVALKHLALRPPKFLIWSYRISSLPSSVTLYLRRNYGRLSAGLWVYSPSVDRSDFRIGYTGRYKLEGPKASVFIDGKLVERGHVVKLRPGWHHASAVGFRLRWVPDDKTLVAMDKRFKKRQKFFDAVYEY